jgi:hypothetical protein
MNKFSSAMIAFAAIADAIKLYEEEVGSDFPFTLEDDHVWHIVDP